MCQKENIDFRGCEVLFFAEITSLFQLSSYGYGLQHLSFQKFLLGPEYIEIQIAISTTCPTKVIWNFKYVKV